MKKETGPKLGLRKGNKTPRRGGESQKGKKKTVGGDVGKEKSEKGGLIFSTKKEKGDKNFKKRAVRTEGRRRNQRKKKTTGTGIPK